MIKVLSEHNHGARSIVLVTNLAPVLAPLYDTLSTAVDQTLTPKIAMPGREGLRGICANCPPLTLVLTFILVKSTMRSNTTRPKFVINT
jgi:hypothetical protein